MKKEYNIPNVEVAQIKAMSTICESIVVSIEDGNSGDKPL